MRGSVDVVIEPIPALPLDTCSLVVGWTGLIVFWMVVGLDTEGKFWEIVLVSG